MNDSPVIDEVFKGSSPFDPVDLGNQETINISVVNHLYGLDRSFLVKFSLSFFAIMYLNVDQTCSVSLDVPYLGLGCICIEKLLDRSMASS